MWIWVLQSRLKRLTAAINVNVFGFKMFFVSVTDEVFLLVFAALV